MKYVKIITCKYCKEKIEVKVRRSNLRGWFVKRVCNKCGNKWRVKMKILILDDREIRHEYFKKLYIQHDLTHVYTSKECIDQLNINKFDVVFLDHDLGGTDNFEESGDNTGYEVAKWLRKNEGKQPNQIILHSFNPVGRKNMKSLLPHAVESPCFVF